MIDAAQHEEAQRSSLQARTDLQDIRDLNNFVPFQRYFLRRLKQRRADIAQTYHETPPFEIVHVKQFEGDKEGLPVRVDKCDPQEREILRRLLEELNTLCGMLDTDEGNAASFLDRNA